MTNMPITVNSDSFEVMEKSCVAFQFGYAGENTRQLEAKSRTLAGRQDDFCLLCLTTKPPDELYPQIAEGEIHYCPRRVCKTCCNIPADWEKWSNRFSFPIYKKFHGFVQQSCPLCWKRCWDIVSPILGVENRALLSVTNASHAVIQKYRHTHWIQAMKDSEYQWRKKFLDVNDTMSITSDRNLWRSINDHLSTGGNLTKEGLATFSGPYRHRKGFDKAPVQTHIYDLERCLKVNLSAAQEFINVHWNDTSLTSLIPVSITEDMSGSPTNAGPICALRFQSPATFSDHDCPQAMAVSPVLDGNDSDTTTDSFGVRITNNTTSHQDNPRLLRELRKWREAKRCRAQVRDEILGYDRMYGSDVCESEDSDADSYASHTTIDSYGFVIPPRDKQMTWRRLRRLRKRREDHNARNLDRELTQGAKTTDLACDEDVEDPEAGFVSHAELDNSSIRTGESSSSFRPVDSSSSSPVALNEEHTNCDESINGDNDESEVDSHNVAARTDYTITYVVTLRIASAKLAMFDRPHNTMPYRDSADREVVLGDDAVRPGQLYNDDMVQAHVDANNAEQQIDSPMEVVQEEIASAVAPRQASGPATADEPVALDKAVNIFSGALPKIAGDEHHRGDCRALQEVLDRFATDGRFIREKCMLLQDERDAACSGTARLHTENQQLKQALDSECAQNTRATDELRQWEEKVHALHQQISVLEEESRNRIADLRAKDEQIDGIAQENAVSAARSAQRLRELEQALSDANAQICELKEQPARLQSKINENEAMMSVKTQQIDRLQASVQLHTRIAHLNRRQREEEIKSLTDRISFDTERFAEMAKAFKEYQATADLQKDGYEKSVEAMQARYKLLETDQKRAIDIISGLVIEILDTHSSLKIDTFLAGCDSSEFEDSSLGKAYRYVEVRERIRQHRVRISPAKDSTASMLVDGGIESLRSTPRAGSKRPRSPDENNNFDVTDLAGKQARI